MYLKALKRNRKLEGYEAKDMRYFKENKEIRQSLQSTTSNVAENKSNQNTAYSQTPEKDVVYQLELTPQSMLNGIIMSEILNKPKSLRKGRWCI
jgi:hypothetical protein